MAKQSIRQLAARFRAAQESTRSARSRLVGELIEALRKQGNRKHQRALDRVHSRIKNPELVNLASGEYGLLFTEPLYSSSLNYAVQVVPTARVDCSAARLLGSGDVGAVEFLTIGGRTRYRADPDRVYAAVKGLTVCTTYVKGVKQK